MNNHDIYESAAEKTNHPIKNDLKCIISPYSSNIC